MDYSNFLDKDIVIKDINTYGNAINVVPKTCSIVLKINPKKIEMNDLIQNIKSNNLILKLIFTK